MVINSTHETMVMNVIIQPVGAKLSAIIKIRKYKRFHEGHQFILMAMEVDDIPRHDMNHLIRECVLIFHDR